MYNIITSEAESPEAGEEQTGTAALRSPVPETENRIRMNLQFYIFFLIFKAKNNPV